MYPEIILVRVCMNTQAYALLIKYAHGSHFLWLVTVGCIVIPQGYITGTGATIPLPVTVSIKLSWGPFYYGVTLIMVWISNHMYSNVWAEITYPFPNFNGAAGEYWEWTSKLIPQYNECNYLITLGLNSTHLIFVKRGIRRKNSVCAINHINPLRIII